VCIIYIYKLHFNTLGRRSGPRAAALRGGSTRIQRAGRLDAPRTRAGPCLAGAAKPLDSGDGSGPSGLDVLSAPSRKARMAWIASGGCCTCAPAVGVLWQQAQAQEKRYLYNTLSRRRAAGRAPQLRQRAQAGSMARVHGHAAVHGTGHAAALMGPQRRGHPADQSVAEYSVAATAWLPPALAGARTDRTRAWRGPARSQG
jgi:hypothetical protein